MARKKKKQEIAGATWLDTYADTITLLMTFFVLLFSMSTLDAQKFKEIAVAFNAVFTGSSADSILEYDIFNGEVPIIGGEVKDETELDKVNPEDGTTKEESTYEEVSKFVKENDLASVVTITTDERGVIIQIKDSILFETGEAELKANSLEVLGKINALIATLPNNIIIEGHTDNVPINTYQYPTNYELSGARAARVLRYFTEQGQDPLRFVFQGYGDVKPLYPNNSDENRAKNRRVNILIVANNEE